MEYESKDPSAHNPLSLAARELPTDRLATTDEQGRRVYIYPADVRGYFRNWRNIVHSILILIFLITPWLRVGGRQLMLLDIVQRRFTIFGVTFWAHDAPMLVFIFGGAALTLVFATALWGRVWCGWACPQTVFIESIFRRIERLIEGDGLTRKRADLGPMTSELAMKKALKWFFFIAAALIITHSFLAYFIDTRELAHIVRRSPSENIVAFTSMLFITGLILFDFGWFREQFCTIACPYGRFQSVLMDEDSLQVTYDPARGEPRKGSVIEKGKSEGDCINCYRCVHVCPTGVDIRRGQQLECIACTACIDACDEVMTKLKKPTGLIRYDSLRGLRKERTRWMRPRTTIYLAILGLIAAGLTITLALHENVQATFVRAIDIPYEELQTADGEASVVNRYKVDLANQTFETIRVTLQTSPELFRQGVQLVMPISPLEIEAGKMARTDLFIKFPRSLLRSGRASLPVNIHSTGSTPDGKSTIQKTEELTLVGPFF